MRNNSLEKIESALGFKLTDLQKKVICAPDDEFLDMKAPEGRLNYTTTSAALRLLLSEGDTVIDLMKYTPPQNGHSIWDKLISSTDTRDYMLVSSCAGYSGDYTCKRRYFIFCDTVCKLYNNLWSAGINLRDVKYRRMPLTIIEKKSPDGYLISSLEETHSFEELKYTLDELIEKMERLNKLKINLLS